jgi:hypothetical protein
MSRKPILHPVDVAAWLTPCKPKRKYKDNNNVVYRVIHERGTSEFLFCRNQQYQWQ